MVLWLGRIWGVGRRPDFAVYVPFVSVSPRVVFPVAGIGHGGSATMVRYFVMLLPRVRMWPIARVSSRRAIRRLAA